MHNRTFRNKEYSLPLYILGNGSSTTNPHATTTPSLVDAPQQLIAGKADTLRFAVDNSNSAVPLTITLAPNTVLDPAVFTIVPSGPDSCSQQPPCSKCNGCCITDNIYMDRRDRSGR